MAVAAIFVATLFEWNEADVTLVEESGCCRKFGPPGETTERAIPVANSE
jgi:hypothetical protein